MRKNVLFIILFSTLYISTYAQEKNETDSVKKVQELEEVVVSVNKWEQKLNEVPNKIAKITSRDVRLQNPQTAADLLALTGEVFIQKSQMGGGSPMIRGFSTNRVMIVVDGVRMNNAIYRSGNLQNVISLDALSTETAEVIFGPGSIIYGSDAIGGVMDFHSFQPRLSTTDKLLVRGSALARYSTANQEKTGHIDFNLGTKKLSFFTSITWSDFDDLKMGKHGGDASYLRTQYVQRINNSDSIVTNSNPLVQRFTGYSQLNVLQKIRFVPAEKWDMQYAYYYSGTGDVPRYDRLIEYRNGNLRFAKWYYGPQLWRMHNVQVLHKSKTKLYNSARFIAAYQDYEESRHDRSRNSNSFRHQTEKVTIFSANLDLHKTIDSKTELFYGLEWIKNDVGSFGEISNINTGSVSGTATRYPNNSKWKSYAAYVSYKRNLGEKFTVTTGVRYNYVTLSAPFDTTYFKFPFTSAKINDGALTGSLGLVFRPDEVSQLNFNLSTGFRVPNVDDVGKVFESAPGIIVVPNPNLRSEYAYNIDWGYARNFNNKFKFDITCFYTLLDNALVRRASLFNGEDSMVYDGVLSEVQSLQNAARARVWGLQAGTEVLITENFSWLLRGNWIEGKETDDRKNEDVPLRHAPPFYGTTHLKFTKNKWQADLYLSYNAKISNKNLAPSEREKVFIYARDKNGNPYSPSWHTLNFKATCQVNTHFMISLGCENITNRRYRPYSSGIVAPGINLIASARLNL